MIPAQHPYQARFKHAMNSGKTRYSHKPVIAWDDDGHALVADESRGCLVMASSYSNFDGVSESRDPVVGVIPGGGWRALYNDDGKASVDPLIAWLVHPDGSVVPVDTDNDGITSIPTEVSNFVRLLPPGEEPPTELE